MYYCNHWINFYALLANAGNWNEQISTESHGLLHVRLDYYIFPMCWNLYMNFLFICIYMFIIYLFIYYYMYFLFYMYFPCAGISTSSQTTHIILNYIGFIIEFMFVFILDLLLNLCLY